MYPIRRILRQSDLDKRKDDDHGKKVAVVKAEIEAVRVNIS